MRTFLRALVLAFSLQSSGVAFAEPTRVAFQVVCDDSGAKEMIASAIRERLEAAGLRITDQFPVKKLLVYAQRDVGDTVNTNGWSFAIVHASNQATYFVASKLLSSTSLLPTDVKSVLVSMVREEGFLSYVNVAHVDRLDNDTVTAIAVQMVDALRSRVPSEQPVGK